ncbi:molybdopterin synthase catalytic subunit MoaE [Rosenbergiella epipactidis]|uniref:molybdopterin synthase catalytic subunit MoaE n=1 Tax=Rosenbergiella epipactidis TaxID=1544694 RepID=UPI001F4EB6E6|nr:molybdopterin synthase catalytic subunit MoaE [Rosenbergiella epipactidis]
MPALTRIEVTTAPFNLENEYRLAASHHQDGAIVFFVGKVRDMNQGQAVSQLTLEHYPGMTERVLNGLAVHARERFAVNNITIIHRVGTFSLGEDIVLVIVSAIHRHAAFLATEFIMDLLKSQAPFWKRESTAEGTKWLSPTLQDSTASEKWNNKE